VGEEMYRSTAHRVDADRVIIPEVVSGTALSADL